MGHIGATEFRDKLDKKRQALNWAKIGMEQTRPVEIQDVLTTNEIITLLTQQRKVIDHKLSHLQLECFFLLVSANIWLVPEEFSYFYDIHVQFNIKFFRPIFTAAGKNMLLVSSPVS